ncbi:MAG TPA: PAS domain-containing protein, partial [Roseiarcus sp.]|nr:PAS domain-containing protein [Roseiarcus sp.]
MARDPHRDEQTLKVLLIARQCSRRTLSRLHDALGCGRRARHVPQPSLSQAPLLGNDSFRRLGVGRKQGLAMFDLLPGFGARSVLAALKKSLAVIEFSPTGDVINANANFCALLGYQLSEIKGKHHSMFVEPQYARSREYEEFWAKLRRGEFEARESKRIGKGGKEVWIQASYSPIVGLGGKLIKVVAVAADVTETKTRAADDKGRIDAISRAQAAIEYSPDGTILAANESFLKVFGYRLEEILGQNHRMFFDPALVQSDYYRENWEKLKRGEFVSGVLHRFGKGGKELWLQSSYNPIFDHDGKVVKVINVATDVTEAKMRAADDKGRIDAINRT